MPGLSGKTNATKNLSKSSPSPSLLTTDDQERGAKAIRAQKVFKFGQMVKAKEHLIIKNEFIDGSLKDIVLIFNIY